MNAGPDFTDLARSFKDLYFVAGEEERYCGADATESGSYDDDLGLVSLCGTTFLESGGRSSLSEIGTFNLVSSLRCCFFLMWMKDMESADRVVTDL